MDALTAFLQKVEAQILNPLITLVIFAAFILFVWGVVGFIRNSDNEEERKKGKQHMLWGIIGLAIMFGAQVFVTIVTNVASSI